MILVDKIVPVIEASRTMIDVNETVVFDASKSAFESGSERGLVFRWVCPETF